MIIRDDIILEDTTLRDGEQAPGIAWSKETKLKVLAELISAGVKWIEVGIPKMGGEELDFVREARDHAGDARLVACPPGATVLGLADMIGRVAGPDLSSVEVRRRVNAASGLRRNTRAVA